MQLLSSLSLCVCCSSQKAKLKNLQNEYDAFKEIVTKSKSPIFTNKKQTILLEDFWPVIRNSEHIPGSLNRSAFHSHLNLVAHEAWIMLYWGGCGKVHKLRKTGPLSHKSGLNRGKSLQQELLMKLRMAIINDWISDIFVISSAQVL